MSMIKGIHSDWLRHDKQDEVRKALAAQPELASQKADGMDYPPIILAANWGREECLRMLLGAGANVDARDPIEKMSALHFAAKEGREGCIAMLIDAGADIEAQDIHGRTALVGSCGWREPGSIQALIKNGANLEHRCEKGKTALMWAVDANSPSCVQAMIEGGADIQAKNKRGESALAIATKEGYSHCSRILDAAAEEQSMEAPWKKSFKLMG